jgi:hypothetical protein
VTEAIESAGSLKARLGVDVYNTDLSVTLAKDKTTKVATKLEELEEEEKPQRRNQEK